MNDEIIEYKQYDRKDPVQKELAKMPAIVHYKYKMLEWWSEFDSNDNEIHFKCNNGFERWQKWMFDENTRKWVRIEYRDSDGRFHN